MLKEPADRAIVERDVPFVPIPMARRGPPGTGRAPWAGAAVDGAAGHAAAIDRQTDRAAAIDGDPNGDWRAEAAQHRRKSRGSGLVARGSLRTSERRIPESRIP